MFAFFIGMTGTQEENILAKDFYKAAVNSDWERKKNETSPTYYNSCSMFTAGQQSA